jgi:integrating conjugative element protein (TIGR03761 family)
LKKFAFKINATWFAAQGDDPFADWFLCLIEQQMEEADFLMAAEIAELQGLLDRPGLLKPQSIHSTEPVEIQLNFANPFPYRAALLIAQYDKLALMALAACHTGQDGKEAKDIYIHAPAKRIRKLFMMADRWKPSWVTRVSYDPANADTRKAEAAMGKLPKAVLNKTLRASIAPDIRKTKGLALPQPDG